MARTNPAGVRAGLGSCPKSPERPLPEFWYPLAQILLVLKALLAATAPERFAGIAARVHRELTYAGAYLRRYLLALAQELMLPPALDCLLTRLDCLARPSLWSGLDPDTG